MTMKRKLDDNNDINHDDNNNNDSSSIGQPSRKKMKMIKAEEEEAKMNSHLNNNNNNNNTDDSSNNCPYLATVNRKMLDFDFEKLCSVTLSNINVYACLVCGKYFQGKGINTPAFTHSLDENHNIFMNLQSGRVYCLPDGYEVLDPTLNDIKHNLNPTYSTDDLKRLDQPDSTDDNVDQRSVGLNGDVFYPGYVGLNNLKLTDGVNVIIQALAHVTPLRNYFMQSSSSASSSASTLSERTLSAFGELLRKMWNPRSFKSHVSPHEFLQALSISSDRRFRIGQITDPVEFLVWFINYAHKELATKRTTITTTTKRGKPQTSTTIITDTFQGKVIVTTEQVSAKDDEPVVPATPVTRKTSPFMFLTLDVPPAPLFKDEYERNIIPQIPIYGILSKFDGKTETVVALPNGMLEKRTYQIAKLPQYVIFHIKRFSTNNFFKEKNPTIVNFPVQGLDMSEYVTNTVKKKMGENQSFKYDLVANICHEGDPNGGVFKVHVLHKPTGKWLEIHDLDVHEVLPQMVSVSEAYLQIYERRVNK